MAQLAIRGHATRGKEVIQLLEMLGCKNKTDSDGLKWFNGTNVDSYYTIEGDNYIHMRLNSRKGDYIKFPLEEFLEKYPYKVGDKAILANEGIVTITNMYWDNVSNQVIYEGESNAREYDSMNASNLQPYTGQEEESMKEKSNNLAKWDLPEGYEFQDGNGNVIDVTKIMLVKKQPQYPKTYEGCCNILKYSGNYYFSLASKIDDRLFEAFYKLKVCRDAYWKIAGEWKDTRTKKTMHYIIYSTLLGEVVKDCQPNGIANFLLDFPTSEIRDAFYENFKELIEECKELL